MRARIFNIMQYEKHPETGETLITEEIINSVISKRGVDKFAYILHDSDVKDDGTPKPPHYHVVIKYKNPVDTATIAEWLKIPENFVSVPKGGETAFYDCVKYLTHESEAEQSKGKHLYPDDRVHCNFDFRAFLFDDPKEKSNHKKIEAMKKAVLYDGKTLKQCIEDDPIIYMNNIDRLKKLRMEFISAAPPPALRLNLYVEGRGGIGKGLICRAIARSLCPNLTDDEDIFFEVGAKGVAFDGYDGQPVIIWNDRRAIDLLDELNGRGNVFNVFDTHPTRQKQNIKYGNVNLCNTFNIVNSVQPYEEFLCGLAGEYTDRMGNEIKSEIEQKGQSYRRFPLIIRLHETDFDFLLNRGYVENTSNYCEYIMYSKICGNFQKIAERCHNNIPLQKKIESKTIEIVVDKCRELSEREAPREESEEEILQSFSDYGTPFM